MDRLARVFREVHGEDVLFGKFYVWQSYDRWNKSFPKETFTNTNAFLCFIESFPIGPERKNKQIDLRFTLYDHNFSEKL